MTSNNIKSLRLLTPAERQEFLDSFDLILCDCDGVIWMGSGPTIPGAGEAVQMLKDKGKEVKFVSNNSLRSNAEYLEKFEKLGIENVLEDDIIHPAKSMVWYLNKLHPQARVFSIMADAATDLLIQHGIDVVPMSVINSNDLDAITFTKSMLKPESPKIDAVVIDINLKTGYAHLVKALQFLKDPECQLILGAMDPFIPMTPNLSVPGFVDLYDFLIKYSQKEPVIVGKPSALLADIVKERFCIDQPERCLFIGDSLQLDIHFGKSVGFQTLFVMSGVDSEEAMINLPSDASQPDYYTASVADFMELFSC